MKVITHVLTNNADWVLPWTLRHYRTFSEVVVHDGGPNWDPASPTRELCAAHGATWMAWDTAGELNDDLARNLKNRCWVDTDADWVIVADADELLWFPDGADAAFSAYEALGAAVIKPYGIEMFSDSMPDPGIGQIYDQIKNGAPDDKWYAKPILFSAKRVSDSGFGNGAHESRIVLKDGRAMNVGLNFRKSKPACLLLHFHQIGSIEQVAARYDATRKRLAAINVQNNWGNVHDSGIVHACKKRAFILPNLRQVVP